MKRLLLLLGIATLLTTLGSTALLADDSGDNPLQEQGEKLLRQAFEKLHSADTFTADLTLEMKLADGTAANGKGTIAAKQPNYLHIALETSFKSRTFKVTYLSDGKHYFTYTQGARIYTKAPVEADPFEFLGQWEGEVDGFFGGEKNVDKVEATYAGKQMVGEIDCDLVAVKPKGQYPRTITYAIGQSDHIIYRTIMETPVQKGKSNLQINTLSHIKLGVPLKLTKFFFTPPPNVKPIEQPNYWAKLLSLGKKAPDFTVQTPYGTQISLDTLVKSSRAVIVNFWFYDCPDCAEELPLLQKLTQELKEKGVEMIAINSFDEKDVIRKYLMEKDFTFFVGLGSRNGSENDDVAKLYGVQAYPTTYLIASDGKVVWRNIGLSEGGIRTALAKLGIK